ncbi:MAG TPA: hypothetical protein VEC12_08680, partial [Bacteroidia bacterium]|nr:hypothetical protein [Bacteroidia bacterium]
MKKLLLLIVFIAPVLLFAQVDSTGNASDSTVNDTMAFLTVEEVPQYPGGETAMRKFIGVNVNYPPLAI